MLHDVGRVRVTAGAWTRCTVGILDSNGKGLGKMYVCAEDTVLTTVEVDLVL